MNGIKQYTTDLKKCLHSSFGILCEICFPELCCILFPFIPTSSRVIVTGTKQLFVAIRYLFLTMKQKLFEEILVCFEEEFGYYLRGFYLVLHYVYDFFRRKKYIVFRGHSLMTSTKNKEWEGAGGTRFWPILLMVVHGFWGKGVLIPWYVHISCI